MDWILDSPLLYLILLLLATTTIPNERDLGKRIELLFLSTIANAQYNNRLMLKVNDQVGRIASRKDAEHIGKQGNLLDLLSSSPTTK